ncbi:hypothetical protein Har1130_03815 [Haloarcula sp. CBA1130]|uniref:hypothetical protein n=1 Tax=unclassified Haloarcula TaxID=2624677 RepID=UPI0012487B22|nr:MULTISPECIES: hypothetical protein [unclassified Haloarcula]KAA9398495.1 hypothetical protein Har1129_09845 [Haloarcula sp. CBA1129]KAA9401914.1 hypothetical protein Har1130_03815 [Haloarcula sp. CBA1130]
MSQRQPVPTYGRSLDPATVAALAERAGLAIVTMLLPVAIGAFVGMVFIAGSLPAATDSATAAMNGGLTAGQGLSRLFYVSTLGTALGCWVLGLGLLLDGLDL